MPYAEYDPSAPYLHVLSLPAWDALRPVVVDALAAVDPAAGTLVELGPGSGIGTELLLDTVPDAPVLATEPSAALRAVLLGRLAAHPQADRLTVLPHPAQDLPLPDRIGAVLGAHMTGHLAPAPRRELWARLVPRLAPGAPLLLTVQPPPTPVTLPEFPPLQVRAAGLTYTGTGGCTPDGPGAVRWRMRYATVDGEQVLHTATAEYRWYTHATDDLVDELDAAGLDVTDATAGHVLARARSVSASGPAGTRIG